MLSKVVEPLVTHNLAYLVSVNTLASLTEVKWTVALRRRMFQTPGPTDLTTHHIAKESGRERRMWKTLNVITAGVLVFYRYDLHIRDLLSHSTDATFTHNGLSRDILAKCQWVLCQSLRATDTRWAVTCRLWVADLCHLRVPGSYP